MATFARNVFGVLSPVVPVANILLLPALATRIATRMVSFQGRMDGGPRSCNGYASVEATFGRHTYLAGLTPTPHPHPQVPVTVKLVERP